VLLTIQPEPSILPSARLDLLVYRGFGMTDSGSRGLFAYACTILVAMLSELCSAQTQASGNAQFSTMVISVGGDS
jgi:hypothetical protein